MLEMDEVQAAARTLGLEVAAFEVRRAKEIAPAFEALKSRRGGALSSSAIRSHASNRIRINTLALATRMPTIYVQREYVEAAGLMSYGPNFPDLFRRAADMSTRFCAEQSRATSRSSSRPSSISSST